MSVTCRLCLVEDAAAINIFSNVTGDATISTRLIFCTNLEIEKNDGLPQHICASCRIQLEEYYHFRRKCYASDRRLREHKRLLSQGKPSDLYAEHINEAGSNIKLTRTHEVQNITQWRQTTLQRIRAEMQETQKHLKDICKQELRVEVEQQIRQELEDVVLPEEKKRLRLKVLDELFYELETYFVQKRNETSHGLNIEICSHVEDFDIGSNSTQFCQDVNLSEVTNVTNDVVNNENDIDIVEIIVDNQNEVRRVKEEIFRIHTPNALLAPTAELNPNPPMVEINMQDNSLYHLREESSSTLLNSTEKSKGSISKEQEATKKGRTLKRRDSVVKSRDVFCRKHPPNDPTKYRNLRFIEKYNLKNCKQCKLRRSTSSNVELEAPSKH